MSNFFLYNYHPFQNSNGIFFHVTKGKVILFLHGVGILFDEKEERKKKERKKRYTVASTNALLFQRGTLQNILT